MSRGYQPLEVDKETVRSLMKGAETLEEFKRFQAIYLRIEGMNVKGIANATGLAESTIHNLHSRCRREGLEAIKSIGRGGRHWSYLTPDEEGQFLASLKAQARQGGILEVANVHKALQERLGRKVALYTTYRLLHRNGWRKVAPRPRHPKADQQAQEDFKKNGRTSSKKPNKKL